MSRENLEIVRAMYDAHARGEYEAAFERLDEDIEWFEPPELPGATTWHGHEGVKQQLTRWLGTWDDWRFEIDELIDRGDHVLVRGRQHGRGKGSGVEVSQEVFHLWTLRAGKAIRMRMFYDRAQALEAAEIEE